MIFDFHTHNQHAVNAIVNVDANLFMPEQGLLYSVGIHPWKTATTTATDLYTLAQHATHRQVVAIGETGLDPLQGASIERQMEIFKAHIAIAEKEKKPLVIHMVRTSQHILKAWKQSQQSIPWVIHGMRGNVNVARPLIEAGFYLSFGIKYNPETLKATPHERILIETDDACTTIESIATQAAVTLNTDAISFIRQVQHNAAHATGMAKQS